MNLTRRKFLKLIGFTLINTGLFGIETGYGFSPKTSDSNFVKDWATLQIDNVPIEYNGKKYSRVLAIGDIHGQYTGSTRALCLCIKNWTLRTMTW